MRIAIAQIRTRAAEFAKTARRMAELSKSAAEQGANLLLFPYAALTSPMHPEYSCQEGYLIDLVDTLRELAKQVACPCVVPVVTEVEGHPYADAMLLKGGEVVPLRLLGRGVSEAGTAGAQGTRSGQIERDAAITFDFDGVRLGVVFTYDDIEDLIESGTSVDVLLLPCAFSYAVDDSNSALGSALVENRFTTYAQTLDAWIVAIGSLGGYGTQVYTGSSFVLSPNGELLSQAPAFEEALAVSEFDPKSRERLTERLEAEVYNRSLHLWEALSMGLADYVEGVGRTDVALVLDGSLESCALAALASDALGPTHVHAISGSVMDSTGMKIASAVAAALRIAYAPVNAGSGSAAGSAAGARPNASNAGVEDLDFCRDLDQIALAASARATGALPISHEDKTHLALEAVADRCHAAALLPFGDVYRSDVRELAHLRNTISHVIPREAFLAYSVPEVEGIERVGETPEARLCHIDVMLASHVEWEHSLSDVAAGQEHPEVAVAMVRLLHGSEAARACYPPCLVVSSRTLFDMHIPVAMAWEDRTRPFGERLARGRFMDRLNMLLDGRADATAPGREAVGSEELRKMLQNLGVELAGGSLPEGIDPSEVEGALGNLFGLLQDLVESGGLGTDGSGGMEPPAEGPIGPITWGSPFSEN